MRYVVDIKDTKQAVGQYRIYIRQLDLYGYWDDTVLHIISTNNEYHAHEVVKRTQDKLENNKNYIKMIENKFNDYSMQQNQGATDWPRQQRIITMTDKQLLRRNAMKLVNDNLFETDFGLALDNATLCLTKFDLKTNIYFETVVDAYDWVYNQLKIEV